VLLTRLELFLRQEGLKPLHVARRARYSRQFFLRLRLGEQMPTARSVEAITGVCRLETNKPVEPAQLFERAELLQEGITKLSALHARDLRVLDVLLEEVTPDAWAERVIATGIRSETAARHLVVAGQAAIDALPSAAAEVFRGAMLLLAELKDSPPELVASLSAQALKGRANALRHLARYDDALADLALSGRLFATARYCDDDAGQVELTRAGILFKRERWAEALTAARVAQERFRSVRDRKRAAHAEIIAACVLFEQGDTKAAHDAFHRLRATLKALRDRDALARVWVNIAACAIRLRNEREARHWLNRASRWFRERANTTEFLRTRWSMGTYLATFRAPALGIKLLRRVEAAFRTLDMDADSACVGLDVLELLIDMHAPRAELGAQARTIAAAFTAAGMAVSMATALDHLRRIHTSPEPRAVLEDVRAALRGADDSLCRDDVSGAALLEIGGAPDL
jgi:tetratricopeptide (TPR) repeat protein